MRCTTREDTLNPLSFAPYWMFDNDVYSLVDAATLPQLSWRERRGVRRHLSRY